MPIALFPMLLICLLPSPSPARDLSVEAPYTPGPARFEKMRSQTKAFEKIPAAVMGFVDAPLDYAHPEGGTTKIFYRLPRALDPAKPSLLFFYGGPGLLSLTASLDRTFTDWNVIYFDQRGTGFSAMATVALEKNATYFSSEFSARDAALVLDSLGVKRVGVYGHSYGTVVATIFAHDFPERVSGLVLEGTIFDGAPNNEADQYRRRLVQNFFDALPAATQARILTLSGGALFPKSWFSLVAKASLYGDHFASDFLRQLNQLLALSDGELASEVRDYTDESYLNVENELFGSFMYHQISCQELSLGDPKAGPASEFFGRTLVSAATNQDADSCRELNGIETRLNRTYFSTQFPLQVPVTYLQGTADGATPVVGAIRHFERVAKTKAQLLLIRGGGHTAVLENLSADPEEPSGYAARAIEHELVGKALRGDFQNQTLIKQLGWASTRK